MSKIIGKMVTYRLYNSVDGNSYGDVLTEKCIDYDENNYVGNYNRPIKVKHEYYPGCFIERWITWNEVIRTRKGVHNV